MSKTIFVIGAMSALAQGAIRVLSVENKIVTGGRTGCDVLCDIRHPIVIPDGVDVVLNFAAAFGGDDDDAILDAVRTNELGVLNVCIAAHTAGVSHVVNVSSMSAVLAPDSPYYSIYAITKRHGDELARQYCDKHNLPLTVLRPSQLYGTDAGIAKHQPFFYQVIEKAENGEDIFIYGTHDALRNYLDVSDLSEVIARIINRNIEGTYPCLYPENVSFATLAKTAQSVFGKGGEIVFLEDKPDTPDNVFDMDLSVYEKIDYRPRVTLEEGIRNIQMRKKGARG